MKINTTDPDLRTIFSRIEEDSLDLQPDFQRAEVWKLPKKKLLIDTILRGWQVPPVHVILNEDTYVQEVLDGQQRLSAIRDFMRDLFKVDGRIEPQDDDLIALDGMTYSKLPQKVRNRFDRYAIRVFEIVEYNQGEPGELFNRLNESLKLTSAEKRNAYVGKLRKQIKSLVDFLEECDLDKSFLGFSNQRMAYHDMFIKLCYMLEQNSLIASYTEKQLNDRARDDRPFNDEVISLVMNSILALKKSKNKLDENGQQVHITKATLMSWLFFMSSQIRNSNNKQVVLELLSDRFVFFESIRNHFRIENSLTDELCVYNESAIRDLLTSFNVRSVSRVMTAASLLIRDFVISVFCEINNKNHFEYDQEKNRFIEKVFCLIENDKDYNVLPLIDEYIDTVVGDI